ncbi:aminoglycoside phosphotransferase family protein [Ureibacillus chungkukjangi]|uniref:Streptomycin 6-kinase n=1 Tax=Ureibacillus chungkukjangi TaxID=1202712 RepID=A0A318TUK3_9BACL|nr:aminoglycoside phosphotransferase family protein [Ureibacillus chungkukjangi]PYF08482.1 streptomycin 6-kinase [Ureibacillus chungkukjangi]
MNKRFREKIKAAFGTKGELWLEQLPKSLDAICHDWRLTIEGEPANLSYNYVAYVKDTMSRSLVLKIGVPGYDFSNEIKATKEFQGEGFVTLYNHDEKRGCLLLERLTPGKMLKELEKDEQIDIYLMVWNRLNRLPSEDLPFIHNWFKALVNPVPSDFVTEEHIETALRYKKEIEESSKGNVNLHGDLHHENILFDEKQGWVAIDPKGVQGDIYYDYISFLFNELNHDLILLETRLKQIASKQALDELRLRKAAIALLTVQVLWAVEDGAEEAQEMNAVLAYLRGSV